MKYHSLIIWSFYALLVSCSIQEAEVTAPKDTEEPEFYASIEDESSRVYVDNQLRVLWNTDDRVSIFNKNTTNQEYYFTGKDGDNSGSFDIVPGSSPISGNPLDLGYSVYPYQESTSISNDGVISVSLPAVQTYKENSFGLGANTMVAVAKDNELMYRNLCGYLAVKLYGDNVTVSSITIKGNNNEPLAGNATVNASIDGAPALSFDSSATNEIRLTVESPVTLGTTAETATAFWFVVPPTTFSNGFTLTVDDIQKYRFKKETSGLLDIKRNTLSKTSALEVNMMYPIEAITLDKSSQTIFTGDSLTLTATIDPSITEYSINWSSNDSSVAIVRDGIVTGVGEGSAEITASLAPYNISATCMINVLNEIDVYVALSNQRSSYHYIPYLLKNDVWTLLTGAENIKDDYLRSMCVFGGHTYIVSGYDLWIDNELHSLPDGFFASSIAVDDNNVYIGGWDDGVASILQNGNKMEIEVPCDNPDYTYSSFVSSLFLYDNHLYAGGYVCIYPGTNSYNMPLLWSDGKCRIVYDSILDQAPNAGFKVLDVYVYKGDLFVIWGIDRGIGHLEINGADCPLHESSSNIFYDRVSVDDDNIYVVGHEKKSKNSLPKLWVFDKSSHQLVYEMTLNKVYGEATTPYYISFTDIEVVDGTIYISGHTSGARTNEAYLWEIKDNELISLKSFAGLIPSIAVVKNHIE